MNNPHVNLIFSILKLDSKTKKYLIDCKGICNCSKNLESIRRKYYDDKKKNPKAKLSYSDLIMQIIAHVKKFNPDYQFQLFIVIIYINFITYGYTYFHYLSKIFFAIFRGDEKYNLLEFNNYNYYIDIINSIECSYNIKNYMLFYFIKLNIKKKIYFNDNAVILIKLFKENRFIINDYNKFYYINNIYNVFYTKYYLLTYFTSELIITEKPKYNFIDILNLIKYNRKITDEDKENIDILTGIINKY